MTDKEFIASMKAEGFFWVLKLPSGEWAGVMPFFFTFGLCVGLDEHGYRTRFCYENFSDPLIALVTWDGTGDPPGPWIKEKGRVERSNPLTFKGIPVVEVPKESDSA